MGFREITMDKFPWDERCKLCGQYIKPGEVFYIIYPPKDDKQLTWGIVHKHELEELSEGKTEEEKMNVLRGKKMPRFKGFTEEQKANAEIFKSLCKKRGFYKETLSKRTLKMRKRGTSFVFTYDMILGIVGYDCRSDEGIFGRIFNIEAISKLQNELDTLIGKPNPCEVTTAKSIFKKAEDIVDEMMGKPKKKQD